MYRIYFLKPVDDVPPDQSSSFTHVLLRKPLDRFGLTSQRRVELEELIRASGCEGSEGKWSLQGHGAPAMITCGQLQAAGK